MRIKEGKKEKALILDWWGLHRYRDGEMALKEKIHGELKYGTLRGNHPIFAKSLLFPEKHHNL